MTLEIRPLERGDWEAAAELLARRHAAELRSEPLLPERYAAPDEALSLIAALLESPATTGVVAIRDGEAAGFLAGSMRTPSPLSMGAKFVRSRAAIVPYDGHALGDRDNGELYRELYAALSEPWVANGYFSHYIEVSPLDVTAAEAFMSLGFGRQTTLAARRVAEPVPGESPADLDILRAGPSELETVMRFVGLVAAHHAASPSFLPYLREPDRQIESATEEWLNDWASAHLIARRGGEPIGMFSLRPPGFVPLLAKPEGAIYLEDGAVAPGARRGGVGLALLREAMQWAEDAGFSTCLLHFLSGNLAGARFWQANGFWPLVHTLARHVDERIAWAHG
ncbi:MAG TPA: GNAT family N-acetyltransferase [Dehalococcoidia bacterium]|nr:GNAT family N-acetyltransferase [Dehalococcoidia bacterium]